MSSLAAAACAAGLFLSVACCLREAADARRPGSQSANGRSVARGRIARFRADRAQRQADRDLPDALEHVARALRGGASLTVAVREATPHSDSALAPSWQRLAVTATDEGVAHAARRWATSTPDSSSTELAAAGLAIAATAGGSQARALDSVAMTLRQRASLDAELRAQSSQARASAFLIATSPLVFMAIASGLEPRYLGFLLTTPPGLACLGAGLVLDVAGFAWMGRITRVEL